MLFIADSNQHLPRCYDIAKIHFDLLNLAFNLCRHHGFIKWKHGSDGFDDARDIASTYLRHADLNGFWSLLIRLHNGLFVASDDENGNEEKCGQQPRSEILHERT